MGNQQIEIIDERIVQKLVIYMFIQKFYAGHLNQLCEADLIKITNLIKVEWQSITEDEPIKDAYTLFTFTKKDVEEIEFEFNRLFVGPNRLEASPYESTYRNDQRSLMQNETLAVRDFYKKAGLEVLKKNVNPDDHLALELEFVCYLLENSKEDSLYYKLYQDFLQDHLLHWVDIHCELVSEKTNNQIIKSIAYLLQNLLSIEKNKLSLKGGK